MTVSIRMPIKERWGVLTQADSALAQREYVAPEDLTHMPLLIAKRSLVRDALHSWFGTQFEELEIIGAHNLTCNAAVMVKNGVASVLAVEHNRTYEGLRFVHVQECAGRMTDNTI